jgi:enoyl-CoA hydratase/carnithine racemase
MSGLLALVGRAATLAILLEGRVFGAAEARELGLLTRVVPDDQVVDAAKRSAERIAAGAPLAARINKRLSRRLAAGGALTEDEYQDYFSYADSRDHKEGVRAFLAGVDPSFSGD